MKTKTNRRGFFKRLLLGGAAFTILPGAGRIWRARLDVPSHAWFNASRMAVCESDACRQFIDAFLYGKPLPPGHPAAGQFCQLPSIVVEAEPFQNHLQKLLGVEPTS